MTDIIEKEQIQNQLADILLKVQTQFQDLQGCKVQFKTVEEYETDGIFARAIHQSRSKQSVPELVFTVGSSAEMEKILESRKHATALVAKKMSIPAQSLTTNLLIKFIFLHELGHLHHYIELGQSASEYEKSQLNKLADLPMPGLSPGKLIKMIADESPLQIKVGGTTESQLIYEQELAYRNLPEEKYADNFAINFLRTTGNLPS